MLQNSKSLQIVGHLVIGFSDKMQSSSQSTPKNRRIIAEVAGVKVWTDRSCKEWRGFPLTEIKASGFQIWLLGELYGSHFFGLEGERRLGDIVSEQRSATELNGHFLLLAWNEEQKQWHIWTNRFGTMHAYHACLGGAIAIGTSFDAVTELASRKQLDWTALIGFFGFGFFPEDRTYYDDVRILRPATHYVYNANGQEVSAKRYWEWHHGSDQSRSYDDTVAEFGSVFELVMSDLLRHNPESKKQKVESRIAIPISGGLDSRSTVAALPGLRDQLTKGPSVIGDLSSVLSPQSSDDLWAYSYGYSDDSVETRISRQIAEARSLPFTSFTIKPYLFDRIDLIRGAVEGFQDITQCRQAFIADELGRNADYVIAAHWGDVWLDDMGITSQKQKAEVRRERPDGREQGTGNWGQGDGGEWTEDQIVAHTLKKMAKRGRGWLLDNLCLPNLNQEKPDEILHQFVAEGMGKLSRIEDADFRVKAFKTDQWSFRWTLSSIRMFQAAAFPRLPFYDIRLADFFCTVPSDFVSGRRLQIDYLKRFAPDLARIEWQARGANLYRCQNHDIWQWPYRAVKKAARLLTGKKIIERNWEVQFGGEQGQKGLSHWLLRPGLRLHDLVPRAKIEQLLRDFRADPLKDGRGYTVSMLLTFSAFLQGKTES
jgi:hypothetical protein